MNTAWGEEDPDLADLAMDTVGFSRSHGVIVSEVSSLKKSGCNWLIPLPNSGQMMACCIWSDLTTTYSKSWDSHPPSREEKQIFQTPAGRSTTLETWGDVMGWKRLPLPATCELAGPENIGWKNARWVFWCGTIGGIKIAEC